MVKPTFLLDTNAWIYVLKGRPTALVVRLGSINPEDVAFCSIVKAELLFGAYRYSAPRQRLDALHALFSRHRSIEFDDAAAEAYGPIRYALEKSGQVIGPMDMLIAAIAVANDLTLVTNNTAEFQRVPDLRVVDWTNEDDR